MVFHGIAPATAAESAWLAALAYDEDQELVDLLGEDWRPLGASDLGLDENWFDGKGYYEKDDAAGYLAVDTIGKRLALVFRGSDSVADLISVVRDQENHFDDLRPLIQAALDYADTNGIATMLVTGHSLGGAMVQRAAAKMHTFDPGDAPLEFVMTAFGPPGTDVGNTSPLSRSVLNFTHSGDPATSDRLLSPLTHHGPFVTIKLPNVEGADTLADLARQKEVQDDDPSIITEHDMPRYLKSLQAIAASDLLAHANDKTIYVVLDRADGSASDDAYSVRERRQMVLGLDGDDTLTGSKRRDLLDGGEGDDWLSGGADDDVLAGGPGNDGLSGDQGADRFVFAGSFGDDVITDFKPGDTIELRGFGSALDTFDKLAAFVQPGLDLRIDLRNEPLNGGTITLLGVSALDPWDVSLIA